MLTWLRFFGAVLILGCGGTLYRPGHGVVVHPHDSREIDDDAIRNAFAARPQLRTPTRVAWFNVAPEHDAAIEEMLQSIPAVSGTYQIPTLLADGRRRFHEPTYGEPAAELSLSRLRLIAARARCDVLLVFDYGYRVRKEPNAWAALNVLVLPTLFVPFLDTEAESYLDAYVIDVRNGYLYGHASETLLSGEDEGTIWSDVDERLVAAQWGQLIQTTGGRLAVVLSDAEGELDDGEDDGSAAADPAGDDPRAGTGADGTDTGATDAERGDGTAGDDTDGRAAADRGAPGERPAAAAPGPG